MRGGMVAVALAVVLAGSTTLRAASAPSPIPGTSATLPLVRDAGRLLVALTVRTREGRDRPVLAWLNMGTAKAALAPSLRDDLALQAGEPLDLRFGAIPIEIPGEAVADDVPELGGEDVFTHLFAPRRVELILPARALASFAVVLDGAAGTLTLARPGTLHPQGTATPLRVAPDTGIVAVDATVAGEPVALAVDPGAAFTWLRGDLAARWLARHPEWRRAEGAVGPSNMGLVDLAFEQRGTLMRLSDVAVGPLRLGEVGALGTAPLLCGVCDGIVGDLFWDHWAADAPARVAGWIGNDVLCGFRLTIDYPNRTLYWLRQRQPGPRPIDSVGLSLVRRAGGYSVGGIVAKDGRPTVEGAAVGDRLVAIDGRDPQGAASDDVAAALGGAPGTRHTLALDRNGLPVAVEAVVTRF